MISSNFLLGDNNDEDDATFGNVSYFVWLSRRIDWSMHIQ